MSLRHFHGEWLRPVCDARLGSHLWKISIKTLELEILDDVCQKEKVFNPGQILSQTSSLSNPKGDISIVCSVFSLWGDESLWSENFWIPPVALVHVNRVG